MARLKLMAWLGAPMLTLPVFSQPEQIELNSSRQAITITTSDQLRVTISYPDVSSAGSYDWWVVATTSLPPPDDLYFYNGAAWVREQSTVFQQPLTRVDSLEVLSGTGLPVGDYVFYFGTDPHANGELDLDSISYSSVALSSVSTIPITDSSCGNSRQLFGTDPLDADAYFEIDPLGATNPSGHTFPTVHTYMMLTDNSTPRNVYAPGDITLTRINAVENLSFGNTDYSFDFQRCPEVFGYFDHLSSLDDSILAQLEPFDSCQQYVAGDSEYRFCSKSVSIPWNEGEILGRAGGGTGLVSAALDFGLRDTRVDPLYYVNPDRLVNQDQLHVVCPFDYFLPGSVRAGLVDKLRVAREDEPVCGRVAQDVPNTAQGRWYLSGSTDFSENDHLALVPSSRMPDSVGVLSVGNGDVGTDAYFFDYSDQGRSNRRFADITSGGGIFCFDSLRSRPPAMGPGSGQPLAGILFLELDLAGVLTLERDTATSQCPGDPATLAFSSSAVEFSR